MLFAGRSLLGSSGPPPGLTDEMIRAKFRDRPINANVNALAHLHLGGKALEYLVDRQIINYGDGVTKMQEARAIARGVNAFIDRWTKKHQAKESLDVDEFKVGIQDQVKAVIDKLAAILVAGEKKLGSADAELANPMAYPLKVMIALVIDDLCRLFATPNKIQQKCDEYILPEKNVEDNEVYGDFMKFLKAGITRGNGTNAHKYLRIAVCSIGLLSRDGGGIDAIQMRVKASLADHGALRNDALEMSDIPDFQEVYDNLNAMFNNEELSLKGDGGAFSVLGCMAMAYFRDHLELKGELKRKIDTVIADIQELRDAKSASENLSEDEQIAGFFTRVRAELQSLVKGFADGSDGRTTEDRQRTLRNYLTFASRLLEAFGDAPEIVNKGRIVVERGMIRNDTAQSINEKMVEELQLKKAYDAKAVSEEAIAIAQNFEAKVAKLEPPHQQQIRFLAQQLKEMFTEVSTHATVMVSDKEIPPAEARIPYFKEATDDLAQMKKDVLRNMAQTAMPTLAGKSGTTSLGAPGTLTAASQKAIDAIWERAMNLILFHNHAIFLRMKQWEKEQPKAS
ncbi:MAG: hypothetical protein JNK11_18745 [Alphaproteobacteria bacterium]|nr:hypothetical protein [Alphaproteobacteria bacterium]